jgi:hypothetical protein
MIVVALGAAALVLMLLSMAAEPWLKRLTAVDDCKRPDRNAYLLNRPFRKELGNSNIVETIPLSKEPSDDNNHPVRSTAVLCEDGRSIGPAHAAHDDIRALGAGRFSHWRGSLYFSSSDNSDPNTNGRAYELVFER